tara:strand:- start:104 stop:214 length:111 start_codon:yes stop_codon:yes gene_type:complete
VDEFREFEAAKPNVKADLLSGPEVDDLDVAWPRDLG